MTDAARIEQFDDIHRYPLPFPGKLRLAASGLGWKPIMSAIPAALASELSDEQLAIFTARAEDLRRAQWMRAARGYRCKLYCKDGTTLRFDGFAKEDLARLRDTLKQLYGLTLDAREPFLKGWNWGKSEFQGNDLVLLAQNRTVLEIPMESVATTHLPSKNEVALEFAPMQVAGRHDPRSKWDQVVEVRFFVPGTVGGVEEGEVLEEGADADNVEQSAAAVLYEQIKQRADIGQVVQAGEAIAVFPELLCLIPRGRFDLELFAQFMRLRGKTYDYKILYASVQRMFIMPKPDEVHMYLVFALDPPIRQGQTRYPHLVFQLLREEVTDITLNIPPEEYAEKWSEVLEEKYDEPTYEALRKILEGVTRKQVILPGGFRGKDNTYGLKCSMKANEGYLFPLENQLVFCPKPVQVLAYRDISNVTMSRMDTTRTFDLRVHLRSGMQIQFSSINREENAVLQQFLHSKGVRVTKDVAESKVTQYAEEEDAMSIVSSDEDMGARQAAGAADEDSEEDADFVAAESADDDIPEEFDEEAEGNVASDEE